MNIEDYLANIGRRFTLEEACEALGIEPTYKNRRALAKLVRAAGWTKGKKKTPEGLVGVWRPPSDYQAPEGDDGRAGAKYERVEATGDYRFWVAGQPGAVVLSADQVREILWQYSSEGEGLTQSQVARAHGMTRRTLNGILKALGFVKADLPYTDEEAADRDPDDLAEELAARMRAKIDNKANRLKWKSLEDDAQKWRALELSVLQYVGAALDAVGDIQPPDPRQVRRAPDPFAVVMALTDFHIGKGFWGGLGPGAYGLDECRRRLRAAVDSALAWMPGAPERWILPIGGDLFQSDGVNGTTARGTPQDHDGTPERMIVEGFGIVFALVRELMAVAPVQLVYNRGNHDPTLSLAIFAALEQWAAQTDGRLFVESAPDRYGPYVSTVYGQSLICFHHGDGRSKPHELATLAATRWPDKWAATRFREWHLGHVHHTRVVDDSGVTLLTNPSLSGSDRYHGLHWPHAARPSLACHVYDHARGRIATIYGVTDE